MSDLYSGQFLVKTKSMQFSYMVNSKRKCQKLKKKYFLVYINQKSIRCDPFIVANYCLNDKCNSKKAINIELKFVQSFLCFSQFYDQSDFCFNGLL